MNNTLTLISKEERIEATLLEDVRFNGGNDYVKVQLRDSSLGMAYKNAMLFEGNVFHKSTTVFIKPDFFRPIC